MTIKNSKNLYFWPISSFRLLLWRLYDIQNYCNSVFISFPNCSYICVRRETSYWPKRLCTQLRLLKKWESWGFVLSRTLNQFCNLLLKCRIFNWLYFDLLGRLSKCSHYLQLFLLRLVWWLRCWTILRIWKAVFILLIHLGRSWGFDQRHWIPCVKYLLRGSIWIRSRLDETIFTIY